jgi:hypothetical protein
VQEKKVIYFVCIASVFIYLFILGCQQGSCGIFVEK